MKTQMITTRIPVALHRAVLELAYRNRRSMNEEVTEAIRQAVSESEAASKVYRRVLSREEATA
ncbi:MAG TPA: hypothetical protein VNA25_23070 [Phycisphaerae bacterium]|nr:hypothetical protein [Phycisphaerae bacterium]